MLGGAVLLAVIAGILYAIPATRRAIYGGPTQPVNVQLAALVTRTIDRSLTHVRNGCVGNVCGLSFAGATATCVGAGDTTSGPGTYACTAVLRTTEPTVGFTEQWRGTVTAAGKMSAVWERHSLKQVSLAPQSQASSSGAIHAGGSCSTWLAESASPQAAFIRVNTAPPVSASYAHIAAAYGTAMCKDAPNSTMPSAEQMVALASASGHTNLYGGG